MILRTLMGIVFPFPRAILSTAVGFILDVEMVFQGNKENNVEGNWCRVSVVVFFMESGCVGSVVNSGKKNR